MIFGLASGSWQGQCGLCVQLCKGLIVLGQFELLPGLAGFGRRVGGKEHWGGKKNVTEAGKVEQRAVGGKQETGRTWAQSPSLMPGPAWRPGPCQALYSSLGLGGGHWVLESPPDGDWGPWVLYRPPPASIMGYQVLYRPPRP